MNAILEPGQTCQALAAIDSAGVIVDARDYFRNFHRAAASAQRRLLLCGWQFDSDVSLLRGADAEQARHPVELLPFLKALVEQRPELRVYMLAWDYSLLYALEREWMQRLRFDWTTSDRIRFLFDDAHSVGASHHQKFAIVDDAIAFCGGIDLCHSRYDDRMHVPGNPLRFNRWRKPGKPHHDCMAYITGPAVRHLAEMFCQRWERAGGEPLELSPVSTANVPLPEPALPVACDQVALSVTQSQLGDSAGVEQIRTLYERAIAAAERSIYMETQYLTSRAVHNALIQRMRDGPPGLGIVIFLPMGADSPKEKLALGQAQQWLLGSLAESARDNGHALRVLYSVAPGDDGKEVATFIHAKVLCVDNRLLSVGSANCTNRSMSLDTELNVAWECKADGDPLGESIARVRASLISEHAGIEYDALFESLDDALPRLDQLLGKSKLRAHELPDSSHDVEHDPLLERAFDPEAPLTKLELEDLLEPRGD